MEGRERDIGAVMESGNNFQESVANIYRMYL